MALAQRGRELVLLKLKRQAQTLQRVINSIDGLLLMAAEVFA
jgi:hypothetical protein